MRVPTGGMGGAFSEGRIAATNAARLTEEA